MDRERTTVDRLVLRIAAAEQIKSIEQVTADEAERVTTSLRQIHLSRFGDHEIITCDPQSGDLVTGGTSRDCKRPSSTREMSSPSI
ncbi:DUF7344 domain-containing protein [Natrinema sp. JCM 9743]